MLHTAAEPVSAPICTSARYEYGSRAFSMSANLIPERSRLPQRLRSAGIELPVVRSAILVLGMHRSGTSALTRVISLLGAELPRRMMPTQDDNAAGFWESLTLVALNNAILSRLQTRWDDWRPVRVAELDDDRLRIERQLAEALTEEF